MLDVGWSELLVIGAIALIVVGPKELPKLLRTVGQFVGKARGMAREFQRSMEDAAREADLKELTDLKRDLGKMSRVDFNEQAKRSSKSLATGGTKPGKAETPPGTASAPAGETPASEKPPTEKPVSEKPASAAPAAGPAAAAETAEPASGADAPQTASGER